MAINSSELDPEIRVQAILNQARPHCFDDVGCVGIATIFSAPIEYALQLTNAKIFKLTLNQTGGRSDDGADDGADDGTGTLSRNLIGIDHQTETLSRSRRFLLVLEGI